MYVSKKVLKIILQNNFPRNHDFFLSKQDTSIQQISANPGPDSRSVLKAIFLNTWLLFDEVFDLK